MKPPSFSYHDPRNISEVIELLNRLPNAKLLAGGQSLMPMLNMRFVLPDHLIDLNLVSDIAFIREDEKAITVGAMTRQRDLEFSPLIQKRLPILGEALSYIGHRQTRNRGTLGGSLSHLDPAAELVTISRLLDASVTITGPAGDRTIPFSEFPQAYMMSSLMPEELLVSVEFPTWSARHGFAFVEFARRHGDFAIVSAATLLETDSYGSITRVALALGGINAAPIRMTKIEAALIGQRPSEELFSDATRECVEVDALGDALVPAWYRQHLAVVLSRRALALATRRLGRTDSGDGAR